MTLDDRTQLAMNFVQTEFVLVEQDEQPRRAVNDLTTQLRSDRTAGSGDQHGVCAHARVEQLRHRRDRVATEQIFDRDVARVGDRLALDQVCQVRNQTHVHRERLEKLDDAFAIGGGGRWHRNEHLARLRIVQQIRQRARRIDVHAIDRASLQQRIVVEKRNRHTIALLQQRARQFDAALASAVDHHRGFRAKPLPEPVEIATDSETRTTDVRE